MVASNTVVPRTGQAGALLTPSSGGAAAFGSLNFNPADSDAWPSFPASSGNGKYVALAQSDPFDGVLYEGSSLFAVDTPASASCQLVYTGPDCVVLVTALASLQITLFETGQASLAIDLNGFLVDKDLSLGPPLGAGVLNNNDANLTGMQWSTRRRVALTSGDKLGLVFATSAGSIPAGVNSFSFDVEVVG